MRIWINKRYLTARPFLKIGLFIFPVLLITAQRTALFPTTEWLWLSLVLVSLIAAPYFKWLVSAMKDGKSSRWGGRLLEFAGLFMLIAGLWAVVGKSIGGILVHVYGEPSSVYVKLKKSEGGGRYSCAWQLHDPTLNFPYSETLCIDRVLFGRASETDFYRLTGLRGPSGFLVLRIDLMSTL